jgi:hypothetical protein
MSINFNPGDPIPVDPADWNYNCDLIAVALHRTFGLPIMAEFEFGLDDDGNEVLGYLGHAWVTLPDGRALDADGIHLAPEVTPGADPGDEWVQGYRIVPIIPDGENWAHLIDIRETNPAAPFVAELLSSQAESWVLHAFGAALAEIGILPTSKTGIEITSKQLENTLTK